MKTYHRFKVFYEELIVSWDKIATCKLLSLSFKWKVEKPPTETERWTGLKPIKNIGTKLNNQDKIL